MPSCPNCGIERLDLSRPCSICGQAGVGSSSSSSKTSPCPFCGEQILPTAHKCKHCGEFLKGRHEVSTNVKQGALNGSVVCFVLGLVVMYLSLWTFIFYVPLFLASFVLSIVGMAQKRVVGGVIMMLISIVIPSIMFFGLGSVRASKALEVVNTPKQVNKPTTAPLQAHNESATKLPANPNTSAKPKSPASPTIPARTSGWNFTTTTSAIDDSLSYYLTLEASEPVGFLSSKPTLVIRHQEGKSEVFVNTGDYLGSEPSEVTVRLGNQAATQEKWSASSDGTGLFCPTATPMFVRSLMSSDRFVFRFTPYSGGPKTATFDLYGLSDAIKPMMNLLR